MARQWQRDVQPGGGEPPGWLCVCEKAWREAVMRLWYSGIVALQ